jgi:hypothetical protein
MILLTKQNHQTQKVVNFFHKLNMNIQLRFLVN